MPSVFCTQQDEPRHLSKPKLPAQTEGRKSEYFGKIEKKIRKTCGAA